jgi:hypothetical protein
MDLTSIASSLTTASAQSLDTSIAVSLLKSDLDSQMAIAQLLAPANTAAAPLANGVGANLDVTV